MEMVSRGRGGTNVGNYFLILKKGPPRSIGVVAGRGRSRVTPLNFLH